MVLQLQYQLQHINIAPNMHCILPGIWSCRSNDRQDLHRIWWQTDTPYFCRGFAFMLLFVWNGVSTQLIILYIYTIYIYIPLHLTNVMNSCLPAATETKPSCATTDVTNLALNKLCKSVQYISNGKVILIKIP